MFAKLFDLASRSEWNLMDNTQFPIKSDRVIVRKALHIYFANQVLPIYSRKALLHLGQLLQVPNLERLKFTTVGLNRAVLEASRAHPELASFTNVELAAVLYYWRPPPPDKRFAPHAEVDEDEMNPIDVDEQSINSVSLPTAPRYLHISAGEKGRLWEEWKREGVANIAWSDLGDLTAVTNDEGFSAVRNAALERNPDWGTGGPRMVWKFRNLRPGDWLIARRGSDMLLGVGQVSGSYFYNPAYEYAHRIPVQWLDTNSRQVDYNFGVMSLGEIDIDRFQTLTGRTVTYAPHIEQGVQVAEPPMDTQVTIDSGGAITQATSGRSDTPSPPVQTINAPTPSRQPTPDLREADLLAHVQAHVQARGYYFTDEVIANYHISLKTRPFVILAGLSGTGKSKLTQLYAEALGCLSDEAYLRLAVQPNWTDVRFLLGYMNGITGKWQSERLLDFVLAAAGQPDTPHFCCLDEMNLARVEYYFSPMLSAMEEDNEADRIVTLYSGDVAEQPVPSKVRLTRNLFFAGTINIDETTQNLSDKVLDRANIIEFYEVDLDRLPAHVEVSPKPILIDTTTWFSFCATEPDTSRREQIKDINVILAGMRQSVGYRVLREVELYLANSAGLLDPLIAFDLQVRQRILPRVRGDHHIQNALVALLAYCETNGLTRSAAKLSEMQERLNQDGYTSFFH